MEVSSSIYPFKGFSIDSLEGAKDDARDYQSIVGLLGVIGLDQHVIPPGITEQDLEALKKLLSTSGIDEKDAADIMSVANLVHHQTSDELTFDPANWEKHTGVLVAAIVAFNISRQASAELRGLFGVLAEKAAREQGAAITSAGYAAMASAIAGAVTAVTMTVAGTKLTLDGHSRKPGAIPQTLEPPPTPASSSKNLTSGANGLSGSGSLPSLDQQKPRLDSPDAISPDAGLSRNDTSMTDQRPAVPKKESRVDQAPDVSPADQLSASLDQPIGQSNHSSQTNHDNPAAKKDVQDDHSRERKLRVGQAVSSLAMVVSGMFSASVRVGENTQREIETLKQSEQTSDRGTSEQMAQQMAEAGRLIDKILATFEQVNQSRNAAIGTMSSFRV
ncbi:IpaC/SipC family type III secretion system effector [Pseudomonas sp. NPDC090202]|uniref:IpaC/SipC family type III secretion system effector n=1 Tax=unclassified Pseudomonas TaxID=196821 RepID=UPI0037F2DE66